MNFNARIIFRKVALIFSQIFGRFDAPIYGSGEEERHQFRRCWSGVFARLELEFFIAARKNLYNIVDDKTFPPIKFPTDVYQTNVLLYYSHIPDKYLSKGLHDTLLRLKQCMGGFVGIVRFSVGTECGGVVDDTYGPRYWFLPIFR